MSGIFYFIPGEYFLKYFEYLIKEDGCYFLGPQRFQLKIKGGG